MHLPIHVSRTAWRTLGFLLLLTVAELLVAINQPLAGLIVHGATLVALLLQAALINQPELRNFFLALTLAPLIRLISLLMPLKLFATVYWYLIVAVPLFAAAFLAARTAGITRQMIGLVRSPLWPQLLISLSGFALGYVEYQILRPAPLVSALRLELIWLPALILVVATGFLEELIFRGLMQSAATPPLGHYAIPYIAAVFAVLHLSYRSAWDFLFVFGVALLFGYLVQRTHSILGVTLAHGLINVMLYLIFPFILAAPTTAQGLVSTVTPAPTAGNTLAVAATLPARSSTPTVRLEVSPTASAAQLVARATLQPTSTPTPQPTPTFTLQPTSSPQATPTPQPTPTSTAAACAGALPARLAVGQPAEAVVGINLRQEPDNKARVITVYEAGARVAVVGGPECVPSNGVDYLWWQVRLADGTSGWSLEGSIVRNRYYLAPVP
ncbi:MAG: CPBP family intramembrane metalloprotease [Chloroflexi bacterium]|nr:CPBP family intramembrane metalloprotease [Chloroflexota bacterium]